MWVVDPLSPEEAAWRRTLLGRLGFPLQNAQSDRQAKRKRRLDEKWFVHSSNRPYYYFCLYYDDYVWRSRQRSVGPVTMSKRRFP